MTKIIAVSDEYIPSKKNATDAGYDLKVYISEDTDNLNDLRIYEGILAGKIYIDGKETIYRAGSVTREQRNPQELRNILQLESPVVVIAPGENKIVSAGFRIKLEPSRIGYNSVMLIYPRSGLASKCGLTLANGTGVIDRHYCKDHVKMAIKNDSSYFHVISDKTRVAQALFTEVRDIEFKCEDWDLSLDRGGGFGSTGVS